MSNFDDDPDYDYQDAPDDEPDMWGVFDDLSDLIDADNALDVAFEYYPADKLGNAEFAADLSGTTDKKSHAYKAALRNVERWRKGRVPKRETRQKIADLMKTKEGALLIALDMLDIGGFDLEVDGDITISEDTRERQIAVTLGPGELAPALAARNRGEEQEVTRGILTAYGIHVDTDVPLVIARDAEITGSVRHGSH